MTSKKEVRFDGEPQKELLKEAHRPRTHSGRQTRSSGRRRKGSRQRKHASEHRLTDTVSQSSKHKHDHHRSKSSRSSRSSNEPCTSAQARLRDSGHHHDSETSSICSTCSSSSSDSDDFAYKLPQRKIYGGVRISYVPNDALACARKEQKKQTPSPSATQPANKKFLALFNFL